MKKVRRAPAIHERAIRVETLAPGKLDLELFGVIPEQRFDDLCIRPDRIAPEDRAIIAEHELDAVEIAPNLNRIDGNLRRRHGG